MDNKTNKTALVTGATSGLGFEAALHLADEGFTRVIITGRDTTRAAASAAELAKRANKDIFESLALDLNDSADVSRAVTELTDRQVSIDFLLLNAGMVSGSKQIKTSEGVEITYSSSLIGHHQLTMGALGHGLLAAGARIVISGSEAARGDVPTFNPVDLPTYAQQHFDSDLAAAATALIRGEGPGKFSPGNTYATAKLFVAWWASSLSSRLPAGTTVTAVSPGSAPGTSAGRNANFFMKRIMMPVMKHAPARLGMAASVPDAARRYIDAADFSDEVTGQFFASAPKKMTGPLHRVELAHVLDRASEEAAWTATVAVAGVGYPASV
jgi:NAD(P)-dependent dehydrogenase (short-subunit alcohol dehydrogenase family)